MKHANLITSGLLLHCATSSALATGFAPDNAAFGASEIIAYEHFLVPRDGPPTFYTFEQYQSFAQTAASFFGPDRVPYGFTKKCNSAPNSGACTSCSLGATAGLSAGLLVCSLKYGVPARDEPIENIPKLAACAAVVTGLWFTNQVSCVTK